MFKFTIKIFFIPCYILSQAGIVVPEKYYLSMGTPPFIFGKVRANGEGQIAEDISLII